MIYQGNLRKITFLFLALYTILIVYFMYVGFGREGFSSSIGNFTPGYIPLSLPTEGFNQFWLFEFGNFAAFLPFGLIIPLLYRINFVRFISLFILSITFLETMQMLSRLGIFDIDDIIVNTLGAAVGFTAQRFVRHDRNKGKGILKIALAACILSLGVIVIVDGANEYFEHGGGKVVALNELSSRDSSVLWDEELSSFEVAGEKIVPVMNRYSSKNSRMNEFTYELNGNYNKIAFYGAIPDEVVKEGSNGKSNIAISIDDKQVHASDMEANRDRSQPEHFVVDVNGANKVTIKITNDDPNPDTNVVMWDVALTELNAGQTLMSRLKDKWQSFF
ncbi:hypothetical protein L3i20_v249550 [Paenibacillus sp. L3-i20]|nr:hypothetical protein L3i20_v249550 [Paenibacillus sp. L3-i20]